MTLLDMYFKNNFIVMDPFNFGSTVVEYNHEHVDRLVFN